MNRIDFGLENRAGFALDGAGFPQMSFLSPWLLVFGSALAAPLWLHLRRRRRQAPVPFPSLRHLRPAAARMRREARLEDAGLLALRLLLAALLVTAFARPVVRSGGGWWGAGRVVESVVVIDATASMSWRGPAGTRFEAAKRLARDWAGRLGRGDALALWMLTDRLERPVPLPVADRTHWLRQLDALEPSDGSCSLAPVFAAAEEWARGAGSGRKEIVVITDNQRAAWDWRAAEFFKKSWPRAEVNLVVLAPDGESPANLALREVAWNRSAVRAGDLLSGVAQVVNHGSAEVSDLLECRVGGKVVARAPVRVAGGGMAELPLSFAVPESDGPPLAGELALAGDAFSADDRWFFAVPVWNPCRSLVVDPADGLGGSLRPGYFLVRALAAGGAGTAEESTAANWMEKSLDGVDALWFTGNAVKGGADWEKALAFAESGGTVALAATNRPEPPPPGWPVSDGPEMVFPATRIATRLLAPEHLLFSGLWSERLPFPPLSQRAARQCQAVPGARTLATLAGELPLIVELPHGKGRVLWLNASADRTWGDLPLSPVFVALAQQFSRASELHRTAAANVWVGGAFPALDAIPGAAWSAAPAARVTAAGLHEATDENKRTLWRCAANVRREESDLRPLPAESLAALIPGRLATGAEGARAWREETRREVPLWPWLLAAAALVFTAESWLAGRTARRRIHAAGAAVPSRGKGGPV